MPKCYKINIEFIANNGNLKKQGVTQTTIRIFAK